jgi:antitoxin PrlF
MSTSILTSKGQTTIPIDIRSYLGLHPGDRIEFFIDDEGRVVIASLTTDVTALKGMLPKPTKKISIEDMNKIIAKRGANDRD